MKLCPKLYIYNTTLEKIVSYKCMIINYANCVLSLSFG
jgi:hypothetical protein